MTAATRAADDESLDPALRSWVEEANDESTDFPIQNLPFGVFVREGARTSPAIGVAIGDSILDLAAALRRGLLGRHLPNDVSDALAEPTLNDLMALGGDARRLARRDISRLLRPDTPEGDRAERYRDEITVGRDRVRMLVPAVIGDYSDFYASIHHATNVGSMFRPDNPLLPNYKYVPIGYHGRASSIVPSGTPVHRPLGQTRNDPAAPPAFGASARMDYELEVGAFIGPGNSLGDPVPIAEAEERIFGLVLVNDWSARDIQAWEYQPLGPFLAKSFATTISPWVVTMEALAPFRVPAAPRAKGDPSPLPYLDSPEVRERGAVDISLEVLLLTDRMREQGMPPARVSRGNLAGMYWTFSQLVAHHASNGCNLRPGDLLASGTVSGAAKDSRGCLLELAWRGSEPVELPGGELRRFLEDGDEVIMRGECARDGYRRIGFGECRGRLIPALSPSPLHPENRL